MITNAIIQWFLNLISFFINLLPPESPPFVQDLISRVLTGLGGLSVIANSPVSVVVDTSILSLVMGIAVVVVSGIFGAKTIIFIWQQVKW